MHLPQLELDLLSLKGQHIPKSDINVFPQACSVIYFIIYVLVWCFLNSRQVASSYIMPNISTNYATYTKIIQMDKQQYKPELSLQQKLRQSRSHLKMQRLDTDIQLFLFCKAAVQVKHLYSTSIANTILKADWRVLGLQLQLNPCTCVSKENGESVGSLEVR